MKQFLILSSAVVLAVPVPAYFQCGKNTNSEECVEGFCCAKNTMTKNTVPFTIDGVSGRLCLPNLFGTIETTYEDTAGNIDIESGTITDTYEYACLNGGAWLVATLAVTASLTASTLF